MRAVSPAIAARGRLFVAFPLGTFDPGDDATRGAHAGCMSQPDGSTGAQHGVALGARGGLHSRNVAECRARLDTSDTDLGHRIRSASRCCRDAMGEACRSAGDAPLVALLVGEGRSSRVGLHCVETALGDFDEDEIGGTWSRVCRAVRFRQRRSQTGARGAGPSALPVSVFLVHAELTFAIKAMTT